MKLRGHLQVQQLYPPTPGTHRKVIWVGLSAEMNWLRRKLILLPLGLNPGHLRRIMVTALTELTTYLKHTALSWPHNIVLCILSIHCTD
jgi:hypothetical protein